MMKLSMEKERGNMLHLTWKDEFVEEKNIFDSKKDKFNFEKVK